MKRILLHLLLAAAAFAPAAAAAHEPQTETEVRNVILMIGDGMGLAQTGALMIDSGYAPLSFDRAQHIALVKTYSANNRVTDSAAAATAMGTGCKTENGRIGIAPDGSRPANLTELAEAAGLSTALVVTSHLADATPSGFAAHTLERYTSDEITAAYADAGIDILAGGGRAYFEASLDGRNIVEELRAKGYRFAETPEEFCAADELPLLGLFAPEYMPTADKRGEEYLAAATAHTLDLLSRREAGFFAMIEGSQIDIACHNNDTEVMLAEMRDFNRAVHTALDFADTHPGTLVVVVADHETGGLTMVSNDRDFTATESGIDFRYSTTSHSGIPVVLYAYGTGSEHFRGTMQNTDIFRKIKELLIDRLSL